MADSHEVSSSEGRNTHTYFEVLLARLPYEKRRTLAPGRLRGDIRDSIHKLIHPNEEPLAGVMLMPVGYRVAHVNRHRSG
jgi:hypothetical protein